MDAGGNVNAHRVLGVEWRAAQREPRVSVGFVENFFCPAMRLRGRFELAKHGADFNPFAVIAAVIFAELLHLEKFGQIALAAKLFLRRPAGGCFPLTIYPP